MSNLKKIVLMGAVSLVLAGCAAGLYTPYPEVGVYPAEVPTVVAYPGVGYGYDYGYYYGFY